MTEQVIPDVRNEPGTANVNDDLTGLDAATKSARDLAERLITTGIDAGDFVEKELGLIVSKVEGIRDRSVSEERLIDAREVPVTSGLRETTHRVVDLGFDALTVTIKMGSEALDDLLAVPRRQPQVAVAPSETKAAI